MERVSLFQSIVASFFFGNAQHKDSNTDAESSLEKCIEEVRSGRLSLSDFLRKAESEGGKELADAIRKAIGTA